MKTIKLENYGISTIDDSDHNIVKKHSWRIISGKYSRTQYAYTWFKGKILTMHRLIMKAKKDQIVDHVNGDGLDNTRSNLRFATKLQNSWNHKRQLNSRSPFVGVCQYTPSYFVAQITNCGKRHFLGVYKTAKEAAIAYDKFALKHRGNFARLNFPQ